MDILKINRARSREESEDAVSDTPGCDCVDCLQQEPTRDHAVRERVSEFGDEFISKTDLVVLPFEPASESVENSSDWMSRVKVGKGIFPVKWFLYKALSPCKFAGCVVSSCDNGHSGWKRIRRNEFKSQVSAMAKL